MVSAVATPINRKRVRDHFAYSFWKYALLVILGVLGWNLIYSITEYRPPKDKKVDVYLVTTALEADSTERLASLAAPEFPDMESISFLNVALGATDDYYANIQLTTYIGAQEGDVYLMPWDRFQTFAESGLFVSLDEWLADGSIDTRGIDPGKGRMAIVDDDGENRVVGEAHIYGLPAETLYGMIDQGVDNRGLWIGVTAYSGNLPNAAKMVDWMIASFQTDKPQWLIDYEASQPAPPGEDEALPSY
ncbi:MAG: hypothetical protein LBB86_05450 [Oscillospiraceae bacterium]|nr:hypothetical protein [Oscillospiraceae bacterium]